MDVAAEGSPHVAPQTASPRKRVREEVRDGATVAGFSLLVSLILVASLTLLARLAV